MTESELDVAIRSLAEARDPLELVSTETTWMAIHARRTAQRVARRRLIIGGVASAASALLLVGGIATVREARQVGAVAPGASGAPPANSANATLNAGGGRDAQSPAALHDIGGNAIAEDAVRDSAGHATSLAAPGGQAGIPPIHPLGPIVRMSRDNLLNIAQIRVLSDGRVLANDAVGKRIVLFDSSLAHFVTVVDATGDSARAYGVSGGGLFPFLGDSSLFTNFASRALAVVDPAGKIVRMITPSAVTPGGQGLYYLLSSAFDAQARAVMVVTAATAARMGGNPGARILQAGREGRASVVAGPPPSRADTSAPPMVVRDSSLLVRLNIETGKTDTVAWLTDPLWATVVATGGVGGNTFRRALRDPMPISDAWTVMPNGTIAIVRKQDYHVDWVAPGGSVTSTPKIAHEWVPITDGMKLAIIDSVRRGDSISLERLRVQQDSIANATGRSGGTGILQFTGGGATVISMNGKVLYMDPRDLPNYLPPYLQTDSGPAYPVRADADGNLWIRASFARRPEGGSVYDIVNRKGVLIDRIQIPSGSVLMGFGPRVAYLVSRAGAGYELERARIQ